MKILIIKFGALGDIIIASSVIRQIQESHENDSITLLTSNTFRSLFDNWPSLIIKSMERKGIINFFRQASWIRNQHFDVVYDLQSNNRSSKLCKISGTPIRAGNHPHSAYNKYPETAYYGQCHSFDRLNQIIQANNLPAATAKPWLPINIEQEQKVGYWLEKHKLNNKPYIICHAGSSPQHMTKRWPYYYELAAYISSLGIEIIWIGAGDELEINRSLADKYGIDATNEFSLPELIALGKHAKFAVTNDSAPMHILTCSNIRVFSLFGPTNPTRNHALGQADYIIFAGGTLPKNDNDFIPADIANIKVDMVIEKIKQSNLIDAS